VKCQKKDEISSKDYEHFSHWKRVYGAGDEKNTVKTKQRLSNAVAVFWIKRDEIKT
jgi:hypothetical protein